MLLRIAYCLLLTTAAIAIATALALALVLAIALAIALALALALVACCRCWWLSWSWFSVALMVRTRRPQRSGVPETAVAVQQWVPQRSHGSEGAIPNIGGGGAEAATKRHGSGE